MTSKQPGARTLLAIVLGIGLSMASKTRADQPLQAGDEAPDFKLTGSDGKTYRLADFRGKKAVVLAWFPKAFTGG